MSTQQHHIRQAMNGLADIKFCRLKSSQTTLHSRSIRGKAALTVGARGPAHNPGYTLFDVQTRDSKGISRWEVVARGDVAHVQAALSRVLR